MTTNQKLTAARKTLLIASIAQHDAYVLAHKMMKAFAEDEFLKGVSLKGEYRAAMEAANQAHRDWLKASRAYSRTYTGKTVSPSTTK